MKLTLALTVTGLLLRFQTPGAGRYIVYTNTGRVVASNHETNAMHIVVPIKATASNETFWVWFKPDP